MGLAAEVVRLARERVGLGRAAKRADQQRGLVEGVDVLRGMDAGRAGVGARHDAARPPRAPVGDVPERQLRRQAGLVGVPAVPVEHRPHAGQQILHRRTVAGAIEVVLDVRDPVDAPRRDDLHQPRGKPRLRQPVGQPRPVKVIERLAAQPVITGRQHAELRGDHRVPRVLHLLVMRAVLERLVRAHAHRVQADLPDAVERGIGGLERRRDAVRIRREAVRKGAQRERGRADLDLQADVAERAPVQRLKGLVAARRLPDVAPPGHLTAAVKGPAAAFVGEMRREVRQRLLLAQELRAGRVPAQPQRLGVTQADFAARAAGNLEMGKRRREDLGVEHQAHRGVRGQGQRRAALEQRRPRRRHRRTAGEKRVGEFLRRAFLQHRHHARQQVRLEQQMRRGPGRVVELRRVPADRDQARDAVLKVAEVTLEGRVLVLETVRLVHGHLPRRIRAQVGDRPARLRLQRTLEHEAAGVGQHRARRPEQRGAVRHARHVQHEGREDVAAAAQVRREVERLVEMVVHVALRRAAAKTGAVAEKQVAAVGRHVDGERHRRGIRDLKRAPEIAHLVVRGRGGLGRRRGVRALGGPDPVGGIDEGFFGHGERIPRAQGAGGRKTRSKA